MAVVEDAERAVPLVLPVVGAHRGDAIQGLDIVDNDLARGDPDHGSILLSELGVLLRPTLLHVGTRQPQRGPSGQRGARDMAEAVPADDPVQGV